MISGISDETLDTILIEAAEKYKRLSFHLKSSHIEAFIVNTHISFRIIWLVLMCTGHNAIFGLLNFLPKSKYKASRRR